MENLPGNEKQSIFGKSKTGEYASLGVLVGAPASWVHLVEGLQALFDRGVFQIALAEFKESSQQQDEANCKFIERDELVTIYRLLQTESKKENPFTLTVARNDIKRLEALKIFEDLQLLRCFGGTDTYLLELLPAKRKLNLDESLRFSGFKNCIKETNKFEEYILTAPVNEIKAYCETILGKGEAIHGF